MLTKRGSRYLDATRARRAKRVAATRAAGAGPAIPISTMAVFNRRGTELKAMALTTPFGFNSIPNTWVETDLLDRLSQGDDIGQRNGRRVYVRAIEIRGLLAGAQSNIVTDDAYNNVRIVIGKYTGGIGALAPLSGSGGAITLSSAIVPGYGQNCVHVYYDQIHTLQSPGRDSVGYVATAKGFVVKLKTPMLCTFSGTGVNTNMDHLVVSCISDSALAPNPGFTFWSAVVYFTD